MHPYANEDAMFERLKDLQREAENARLIAGSFAGVRRMIRILASRAWSLGGLASHRAPRPRPMQVRRAREQTVSQVRPDATR